MPRGRKPKSLEPIQTNHSEDAVIVQVDYKSEKWTVSKLVEFMRKNNIIDDVEIQRGLCWSIKQRSLFIHSVISGYYIIPLLMVKNGNKSYELLDGKQRSSSLRDYTKDGFKLKDIPPVLYDDGTEEDFNDLKFSQLPEDVQNIIMGYNLNMVIFSEETTKEQVEDIFYYSNNGTALRSSYKNFSKAISKDKITLLMNHKIFDRAMTETAREKLAQRQLIINSYIILFTDNLSFDSGDVSKFLKEYDITDENKDILDNILTRFNDISVSMEESSVPGTTERKSVKRVLGRTNFPLIVKFLSQHEGDDDKIVKFFISFFSGDKKASVNNEYNELLQAGSGHLENIHRRLDILNEEFNKFE